MQNKDQLRGYCHIRQENIKIDNNRLVTRTEKAQNAETIKDRITRIVLNFG